jgi:hypothetical protein
MNIEHRTLAEGEQALVRLWRIERRMNEFWLFIK